MLRVDRQAGKTGGQARVERQEFETLLLRTIDQLFRRYLLQAEFAQGSLDRNFPERNEPNSR